MLNHGMRKLAAETFGTLARWFLLERGAIVINDVSGGTITHVGIALTFGSIVLAMIYAVGDVSGLVTVSGCLPWLLYGPAFRGAVGCPLSRQSVPGCDSRQRNFAVYVSHARDAWCDATSR